jgi:hypothetical protein
LVNILSLLKDVGFLDSEKRGDLLLKINPFPSRPEDDSFADDIARVEKAWDQVMAEVAT